MDNEVREALERALSDVQVTEVPEHRPSERLMRVAPAKRAADALIRGRFVPGTGQCVQCGTVQSAHGVKCSADDYQAYREALLEACKSGTTAPLGDYVAKRQAEGWSGESQTAHKLARS